MYYSRYLLGSIEEIVEVLCDMDKVNTWKKLEK